MLANDLPLPRRFFEATARRRGYGCMVNSRPESHFSIPYQRMSRNTGFVELRSRALPWRR
jgi:hypothetical protein